MPAAKGSVPWNAGKSGGWTDRRGYRWIYVTENGRRVARREHRVIVERSLGRRLEPWEIVHHKDGDTDNNDLSNLEVIEWGAHTTEHHAGGRKSEDARRSMQAFALMREEIKREREVKADLLEGLKQAASELEQYVDLQQKLDYIEYAADTQRKLDAVNAIIAKAEGRL